MTVKMTFRLDEATVAELNRTAQRLRLPKSRVVRQAIHAYAARTGRLSEAERRHLLRLFDDLVPQIPRRDASEVDAELAALRATRRPPADPSGRSRRP